MKTQSIKEIRDKLEAIFKALYLGKYAHFVYIRYDITSKTRVGIFSCCYESTDLNNDTSIDFSIEKTTLKAAVIETIKQYIEYHKISTGHKIDETIDFSEIINSLSDNKEKQQNHDKN